MNEEMGLVFRRGLKAGSIAPLSEVIGISEYFVNLTIQSLENPKIIPIIRIGDAFNWYSFSTINAFENTFFNKK